MGRPVSTITRCLGRFQIPMQPQMRHPRPPAVGFPPQRTGRAVPGGIGVPGAPPRYLGGVIHRPTWAGQKVAWLLPATARHDHRRPRWLQSRRRRLAGLPVSNHQHQCRGKPLSKSSQFRSRHYVKSEKLHRVLVMSCRTAAPRPGAAWMGPARARRRRRPGHNRTGSRAPSCTPPTPRTPRAQPHQ